MAKLTAYPSGTFFKIYNNARVSNARALLDNTEYADKADETYRVDSYSGHTALETLQYHRNIVQPNQDYVMGLFIIIDRPDLAEQGVLIVDLESEHGHFDGLRFDIENAGNVLASLEVGNDSLSEEREGRPDRKTPFHPYMWFAVYDLISAPSSSSSSSSSSPSVTTSAEERLKLEQPFRSALFYLDDGLSSLAYESDSGENFKDKGRSRMMRRIYRSVRPEDIHSGVSDRSSETKILDQIIANHIHHAQVNAMDPSMFVVVDDIDWEDKGVLLIRLTTTQNGSVEVDQFRRKGPTAGEMLNWIYIGLMTWEEAKAWDNSSLVSE